MPSSPRRNLIRDGEIATYHVWSRTAQQKFLLGFDKETKQNHEHRRAWFVGLLAHQAKYFAVDVANFHLMGNHFHLMVRTRPDIASTWSDEEVAWRWRMAWPKFHEKRQEWHRRPSDADIGKLLAKPEKLIDIRKSLSSLSWFVARVKEPFAKLCNGEAETQGHFWAERFGSRELVDDAAILACSMYVDVNQVKAEVAPSLSKSMYSAIQSRIIEGRMREAADAMEDFHKREGESLGLSLEQLKEIYLSCSWIAPIRPDGALKLVNDAWQAYVAPDQPADDVPIIERTSGTAAPPDSSNVASVNQPHAESNFTSSEPPTEASPNESDGKATSVGRTTSVTDEGRMDSESHDAPSESENCVSDPDVSDGIVNGQIVDAGTPIRSPRVDSSARQESASRLVPEAEPRSAQRNENERRNRAKRRASEPTYEIHRQLLPRTPPRASDNPFLDMTLEQYLQLAEAAAERVLNSRDAPLSVSLADTLRAHGIVSDAWQQTLDFFHEIFCHVAGAPRHVEAFAQRTGRKSVLGMDACRMVFIDSDANLQ